MEANGMMAANGSSSFSSQNSMQIPAAPAPSLCASVSGSSPPADSPQTSQDFAKPQSNQLAPPPSSDISFGRRGTFGAFKPLPSIQPTFSELKQSISQLPQDPMPLQPTRSFDRAPQQIEVTKTSSQEEIDARAKAMREQRERLARQRKAERAQQLETFKADAQSSVASGEPLDANKKLAIEMLRRFREDIVVESRKQ
jgi:hypothetical protein